MSPASLPTPMLLVFGVSALASVCVAVLAWRRKDPVLFKVGVTLVTFLPVVGPLFGLWVASFPDKIHPDMQAKYKNTVNVYSVPTARIEASVNGKGRDDAD